MRFLSLSNISSRSNLVTMVQQAALIALVALVAPSLATLVIPNDFPITRLSLPSHQPVSQERAGRLLRREDLSCYEAPASLT